MPRRLYILRHAKSAWDTDAATDFDRPLAARGKRDAPRIGAWLHEQGVKPDYVTTSPARRARQTVRRVAEALEFPKRDIVRDPRIYDATLEDLLEVLAGCPATARAVLITGHNPGLEDLVRFLCGDSVGAGEDKLMPTAAVAAVRLPDDWSALQSGQGELEFLMLPRRLP